MRKLAVTAALAFAGSAAAQDGQLALKVSQPLELSGGISAAYFNNTRETAGEGRDGFGLTNAVLNVRGSSGSMGFDLAVGAFLAPSVWGNVTNSVFSYTSGTVTNNEAGVLWGYVSYSPMDKLTLDAGLLTTNIGYEVVNTYANPNINLGAVWFAQPVIYPGARLTFEVVENITLYAEYAENVGYDNDEIIRGDAFALGSLGSVGGIDYAISYYDYAGFKNFVDVVLSYGVGSVDLGLNIDYQWLDDSASGQDDSAYGVALYIIPSFGSVSVPLRLEYFEEGTSGIYTDVRSPAESGYTVTVTPTFKPAENAFLRAEISYASTDRNYFNNGQDDSRTSLAVELGFTF